MLTLYIYTIRIQPTLWVIVGLIAIFPGTNALSGYGQIRATISLLVLFGTSISGFCYCFSYLFKTPSGAQIVMVFLIFVLGLIFSIIGRYQYVYVVYCYV